MKCYGTAEYKQLEHVHCMNWDEFSPSAKADVINLIEKLLGLNLRQPALVNREALPTAGRCIALVA